MSYYQAAAYYAAKKAKQVEPADEARPKPVKKAEHKAVKAG